MTTHRPLTEAKKPKLSVRDGRQVDGLVKTLAETINDRLGDFDLQCRDGALSKLDDAVEKRLKTVQGAYDESGELTPSGDAEFDRIYDELSGLPEYSNTAVETMIYARVIRGLMRQLEVSVSDLK